MVKGKLCELALALPNEPSLPCRFDRASCLLLCLFVATVSRPGSEKAKQKTILTRARAL